MNQPQLWVVEVLTHHRGWCDSGMVRSSRAAAQRVVDERNQLAGRERYRVRPARSR